MEFTLVLIKPHLLYKPEWGDERHNIIIDIINRYAESGLFLRTIKIFSYTEEMIKQFYEEHIGKPFFPELLEEMTSGECVAMIWAGEDAVQRVRKINGATNPAIAEEGTIRHKYGIGGPKNAVHGSDSPESAKREINIIFGK